MLEILDKSITQSEFLGSATHHPPPTARAIRAHDTACQTNLISASGKKTATQGGGNGLESRTGEIETKAV